MSLSRRSFLTATGTVLAFPAMVLAWDLTSWRTRTAALGTAFVREGGTHTQDRCLSRPPSVPKAECDHVDPRARRPIAGVPLGALPQMVRREE